MIQGSPAPQTVASQAARLRNKHGGAALFFVAIVVSGVAHANGVLPAAELTASVLLPAYEIVGDAIPTPLTSIAGDVTRGRAIVANRQVGLCLLCHAGPIPEERFQGNLAPDLAGAGSRWSAGQLRLRIVDARQANAATIMPSYYRVDNLIRVDPSRQNEPILAAQQIEDVVAFLRTLRLDEPSKKRTK